MLVVGPSRCGKVNIIMNLLLDKNLLYYDTLNLSVPTQVLTLHHQNIVKDCLTPSTSTLWFRVAESDSVGRHHT